MNQEFWDRFDQQWNDLAEGRAAIGRAAAAIEGRPQPTDDAVLRAITQEVPDEAAAWIASALADPDAEAGEITFRAARAVFQLVRRYDLTGTSGWG